MEKILFINACIRDCSRTLRLARHLLDRLAIAAAGNFDSTVRENSGSDAAGNSDSAAVGKYDSNAGQIRGAAVEEVDLRKEKIQAITSFDPLERRERMVREGRTDAPELKYARQFADADTIVIAAPYWDLAFPAILKIYLEQVTVTGVTFRYSPEGRPVGMCKARRLFYVMTSGGPAIFNMGYDYICTLCRNFFGIEDIRLFKAENLDIAGNDPEQIMASALACVDKAAEAEAEAEAEEKKL